MGRYPYSTRFTTKECKSVSTTFLKKHNCFVYGRNSIIIRWSNRFNKNLTSVRLDISMAEDYYTCHFRYNVSRRPRHGGEIEVKNHNYWSPLVSTSCYFGGRRWWFICPLQVNGEACGRRVGILYFVDNLFGCRICHNLTYKSCQESHKYDAIYRKYGDPLNVSLDELIIKK